MSWLISGAHTFKIIEICHNQCNIANHTQFPFKILPDLLAIAQPFDASQEMVGAAWS
jgi:hypothetical protein